MDNAGIARVLDKFGQLLAVQGAIIFKIEAVPQDAARVTLRSIGVPDDRVTEMLRSTPPLPVPALAVQNDFQRLMGSYDGVITTTMNNIGRVGGV